MSAVLATPTAEPTAPTAEPASPNTTPATPSAERAIPPAADAFAAGYDLLARLYLDGPGALRRERLPAVEPLLDALHEIDERWPARVEELLWHHNRPAERERAGRAYQECIALPLPGRHVPPYASVYLDGGVLWGGSTWEVLRLYEASGLSWRRDRPARGGAASVAAPDHIGVELAYLALLSSRSPGEAGTYDRPAIAAFLEGHCGRWLPRFLDALTAAGAGPALEGWTAWAMELIGADLHRNLQAMSHQGE